MNDQNPSPVSPANENPKPTRAKKSPVKKTRAPRTVDPAVKAIRDKCAEEIKQVHVARGSEKILLTIMDKRLPKMTQEHRQLLFDYLAGTCQPALIAAAN